MKEIQSPNKPDIDLDTPSIFLAGSIGCLDSGGQAEDWQKTVCELLKDEDVILYNPRRLDWDSSWKQSIYDLNFLEQVEWELDKLEESHYIFMYFDPNTKSPISLLELGLHANSKRILVCCPNGFWRQGNVDIVCVRYGIPLFRDLKTAVEYLKCNLYERNLKHIKYKTDTFPEWLGQF